MGKPETKNQEDNPLDRMIELGHQLKALSDLVIVTAQELKKEESEHDEP